SRDVGLLDFSIPEGLVWMYGFYKSRTEEGVDGWWLDLGEPEGYDFDSHHYGGTPQQVKNEFGQIWLGHISDGLKRDFPEMRHLLMPRAGTSGMQRHSAYPWTGDIARSWEGLQVQIPSLTNMAMSGVSNIGSDIGGFIANGYTNPQLYLRWVQFGAFSPMLRTHSQTYPEPYNSVYDGVRDNVRKAINLRYRMLPYLYTLSYQNAILGLPMARPAGAYDQVKSTLADNYDSYLWGRNVFVAPIVTPDDSRSITFPEGTWLDMSDVLDGNPQPATFSGGSRVTYSAPSDRIPFFLRRGAFLPMFAAESGFMSTEDLSYSDLNVYHYLTDAEGVHEGVMYIDDRKDPAAAADGNYELVHFSEYAYTAGREAGHTIEITQEIPEGSTFEAQDRTYHLHVFGCGSQTGRSIYMRLTPGGALSPMAISDFGRDDVNGEQTFELHLAQSLEEARNADSHAAYYDSQKDMLYLKADVPANLSSRIFLGDIPTGADSLEVNSHLALSYTDGYFNYSVGERYSEAAIDIFSADGRHLATLPLSSGDDAFDSHIHSLPAPAVEGFCIARLTARDTSGCTATAICKFLPK
ncbi:MAG: hypothetical protein K2K29_04830, partial [Muribaculaceae bacterium]|nr:hypothetical protein [Muribaculaceae bacterium]